MKKLLFLLFILPIYIYSASFNELEEAILEVNLEKFEMVLNDVGPLSDSQKIAYANLAQHIIDILNMENYIQNLKGGPESGLFFLGAYGLLSSVIYISVYFATYGYSYKRDGIKPIGVASTVLATFCAAFVKGSLNEERIKFMKSKKLKDSLYIKQSIYFS